MWNRKVLKKKSRCSVKANYWRMIAVCFLTAMLTTTYASSTTFVNQYSAGTYDKEATNSDTGAANSDVITNTVEQITDSTPAEKTYPAFFNHMPSYLIDIYTSGKSVIFSILRAVNSFLSDNIQWASVFLAAGAISSLLYQFLVTNMILVGEKRFFLEARNYPQVRISKIFYLYKLRYLKNPVWVMFCRNIFQWLWNLTIIGGIVKHYEYSMIPFILAENPAVGRRRAFFLSRELMRGNKWKMFLLHFSFLGWQLLSLITLGMLDFLFINPYITGTDTELYMELRHNYILARSPGYEFFNDSLLERVPSEDELLISKALYDDSEGPYTKISYFAPEQYPVFLYSIQPPARAVKMPVHTGKKYGFLSCVFLFFAFSVFGWILESFIHLARDGVFINTGFLYGPWHPLYGLCGLFVILLIKKIAHRPVLSFLIMSSVYTCVGIEYLQSPLAAYTSRIIPEGYSEYSAGLSRGVFFALVSCAFLYYLAPKWEDLFRRLPILARVLICLLLCGLFAADILYTF